MKLFFLSLFVIGILTVYADEGNISTVGKSEANRSPRLEAVTYPVKLDHFDLLDTQFVNLTYYENLEFGENPGPILIYFKDHGDTSTRWIEEGLIHDVARYTNGFLFTANYRFIGDNDILDSASNENLRLFTIDQILADVSDFLFHIYQRHTFTFNNVIVWGSGFGGTIATYVRVRYPHFINGVWSADGTFIRSATSLSYYFLVEYDIRTAGSELCEQRVGEAFDEIEELVETDQGVVLQQLLNACEPIDTNTPQEVGYLYDVLSQGVAVYLVDNHFHGYQSFCRDMNAIPDDPLNSLLRWFQFAYGPQDCVDFSYANYIERVSNPAWDQPTTESGERQQLYLQCTNTGLFPTSNDDFIFPAGLNDTYYAQKCLDFIGEGYSFDQLVYTTSFLTRTFGGQSPVTIYSLFSNGFFYPWIFSGILSTSNWDSQAFSIPFQSKGADLDSIRTFDLPPLVAAKFNILNTVTRWATTFGGGGPPGFPPGGPPPPPPPPPGNATVFIDELQSKLQYLKDNNIY